MGNMDRRLLAGESASISSSEGSEGCKLAPCGYNIASGDAALASGTAAPMASTGWGDGGWGDGGRSDGDRGGGGLGDGGRSDGYRGGGGLGDGGRSDGDRGGGGLDDGAPRAQDASTPELPASGGNVAAADCLISVLAEVLASGADEEKVSITCCTAEYGASWHRLAFRSIAPEVLSVRNSNEVANTQVVHPWSKRNALDLDACEDKRSTTAETTTRNAPSRSTPGKSMVKK